MPATLSGARSRHAVGQVGTYLVVVAIVLAVLIPLFWMVSASLKTQNEVYDFKWLPQRAAVAQLRGGAHHLPVRALLS